MKKHIEIFTDGACSGNPGPGGWGAVLRYEGHEKELSGGDKNTTNNRMELTAVISALSALKEPCSVALTTDSKYVADAIANDGVEDELHGEVPRSNVVSLLEEREEEQRKP